MTGSRSVSRVQCGATIPNVLPLGDAAFTVEFGSEIDPEVNERAIAFAAAFSAASLNGVLDVVPTYRSVTVHFDPIRVDPEIVSSKIVSIARSLKAKASLSKTIHTIPVLYGSQYGPDLENVASYGGLSIADAIKLHSSVQYRIYMLGFCPGFPYMGHVPKQIAMPRLPTPRTSVPAGSVGIAGHQTGIYPIAIPGGWRIIGRTPIRVYRKADSRPFLFNPGDSVRFESIGQEDFDRLSSEHEKD